MTGQKEEEQMGTLIRREFSQFNLAKYYKNSRKASLIIYSILGIGFPVILRLLVEDFNGHFSILSIVITWQIVSNGLILEGNNRQMRFLQTLPIRKSQIVHAKFISVLLLCGCTLVWIAFFILLNMVISGTPIKGSWILLGFFLIFSMIIYMASVTLLPYFLWGYKRVFLVSILFFVGLAGVLVPVGFFMDRAGKEPSIFYFLNLMILSLVIYFICWWVSVQRINKKGFPDEGSSADQMDDDLEEGGSK